jgi:type IV pilus assembly protein PilW
MTGKINDCRGFTLIELLVTIAMFGLIVVLVINAKTAQQDQSITQQQAVEMQQTVRAAAYLMTREIRTAGFNPHYTKYDAGITAAAANTLTFSRVASDDGKDNDGDGQIDEDGELEIITYALQDSDGDGDTDITVAYNAGGAQILAQNITNLVFEYFDESGLVTADLDDIRSIQMTVTVTTDTNELARSTDNNTRALSTIVYLRNLGF